MNTIKPLWVGPHTWAMTHKIYRRRNRFRDACDYIIAAWYVNDLFHFMLRPLNREAATGFIGPMTQDAQFMTEWAIIKRERRRLNDASRAECEVWVAEITLYQFWDIQENMLLDVAARVHEYDTELELRSCKRRWDCCYFKSFVSKHHMKECERYDADFMQDVMELHPIAQSSLCAWVHDAWMASPWNNSFENWAAFSRIYKCTKKAVREHRENQQRWENAMHICRKVIYCAPHGRFYLKTRQKYPEKGLY